MSVYGSILILALAVPWPRLENTIKELSVKNKGSFRTAKLLS
jgi:hypothetical protein